MSVRPWRNRQTRTFEGRVGNRAGSNPVGRTIFLLAGVMELADVQDSKSCGGNTVWVRPPSPAPLCNIKEVRHAKWTRCKLYHTDNFFCGCIFLTAMRDGVQVGDKIITIGGICGQVVKTNPESLVIMVGADKTKFEVMRWSISNVVSKSEAKASKSQEKKEVKKFSPKKLKKETPEENKEEAVAKDENKEPVNDTKEEVVETTTEVKDDSDK